MSATNTFKLYFDGGTDGRNGHNQNGYGSWQIEFNGFTKLVSRQSFTAEGVGHIVTCNVAEWLSLKSALMWLDSVKHRERYTIRIFGDSQLILNQLSGTWKSKSKNLLELKNHCLHYLQGFSWNTQWQPRICNVVRFGH